MSKKIKTGGYKEFGASMGNSSNAQDLHKEHTESFRTAQSNIATLLQTLELGSMNDLLNDEILSSHQETSALLNKFKSNMQTMQVGFQSILCQFQDESLSKMEFQQFIEAEYKKGEYTLKAAEDSINQLESIFATFNQLIDHSRSGSTISETDVQNMVKMLDKAMQSMVGISRVTSSAPKDVQKSLKYIEIEKEDANLRGHFTNIRANMKNQGSNSHSSSLSFEEAIKSFSMAKKEVEKVNYSRAMKKIVETNSDEDEEEEVDDSDDESSYKNEKSHNTNNMNYSKHSDNLNSRQNRTTESNYEITAKSTSIMENKGSEMTQPTNEDSTNNSNNNSKKDPINNFKIESTFLSREPLLQMRNAAYYKKSSNSLGPNTISVIDSCIQTQSNPEWNSSRETSKIFTIHVAGKLDIPPRLLEKTLSSTFINSSGKNPPGSSAVTTSTTTTTTSSSSSSATTSSGSQDAITKKKPILNLNKASTTSTTTTSGTTSTSTSSSTISGLSSITPRTTSSTTSSTTSASSGFIHIEKAKKKGIGPLDKLRAKVKSGVAVMESLGEELALAYPEKAALFHEKLDKIADKYAFIEQKETSLKALEESLKNFEIVLNQRYYGIEEEVELKLKKELQMKLQMQKLLNQLTDEEPLDEETLKRFCFDASTDTMDLMPTTVCGGSQTVPITTVNVSVQNSVASTPRTMTTSNQIPHQEMTLIYSPLADKLSLPLPTSLSGGTAKDTLSMAIHTHQRVPCSKPTDLLRILPVIVSFLPQRSQRDDTSSRTKGDRSDKLSDCDMRQTKAESPVDLSRQSSLSDLSNCLEHLDRSYYNTNTIEPPVISKPVVVVPSVTNAPPAATATNTSSYRIDHVTFSNEDNTNTYTRKNSSEGTAMISSLSSARNQPLPAVAAAVSGSGTKRKLSYVSPKTPKSSNLRNVHNDGVIPPLVKLASDGYDAEGGGGVSRNDESGGDASQWGDAKDRERRISRRNQSIAKTSASQVKTIVIFPINTAHKMTSTDDLNPSVVTSDEPRNRVNASFVGEDMLHENTNSTTTAISVYNSKESSGIPRQSSKLIQRSLSNLATLPKTTSSTTANSNSSSSSNAQASSRLLGPIWKELEMSRVCAVDLESMINKAEEGYRNLVARNKENAASASAGDVDVSAMNKLIESLHNMVGKIILSVATTESNLSEYRSMFDSEATGSGAGSGPSEIARNTSNHLEYEKCRQLYQDCHNRLAVSVNRLHILRPQVHKVVQTIHSQNHATTPPPRTPITPSTISKVHSMDSESHHPPPPYSKLEEQLVTMKIEILALEETNEALKVELESAEADIIELEKEVFEAQQANDRTPGALLFFAAIGDESIPLSLKQLVLQLSQMKSFSESFEHVDFISLRKRLQVCVDCVPTLQRFLSKFTNMYNKWQQDRYKLFLDRSGSISGIDTNSMCPLCFVDTRHNAMLSSTPLLSLTSSNSNIVQGTSKTTTGSLVASPARSSTSKLRKGATSSHVNNVATSSSRMLASTNNHITASTTVNSVSTNMSSLSIASPSGAAGGGSTTSINTTGGTTTTFPIRKMNSSSMISYDAGSLSQPSNLPTIAKRK